MLRYCATSSSEPKRSSPTRLRPSTIGSDASASQARFRASSIDSSDHWPHSVTAKFIWVRRRCSAIVQTATASATSKPSPDTTVGIHSRSEEHTSELQSRENLVCSLLLEKKK